MLGNTNGRFGDRGNKTARRSAMICSPGRVGKQPRFRKWVWDLHINESAVAPPPRSSALAFPDSIGSVAWVKKSHTDTICSSCDRPESGLLCVDYCGVSGCVAGRRWVSWGCLRAAGAGWPSARPQTDSQPRSWRKDAAVLSPYAGPQVDVWLFAVV